MAADPAIKIRKAVPADSASIATLIGALLHEIMQAIGTPAFDFNHAEASAQLRHFIASERCFVFVASDPASQQDIGCLSLNENHAVYAGGSFGTIMELYVGPAFRGHSVGAMLLDAASAFGTERGWKRLEVATPPLPQFERSLAFYTREGFAVTGGRKLKRSL